MGPHLLGRGKSLGFSRVAPGTWDTFSSYGGDGHSKLMFVHRRQYSCLVTKETTGISKRLGSAIRMLLEVKLDTTDPFLGATVILGFISIFTKSQAFSPFEALNSTCPSRCQRDVRPPVQMRRETTAFSRVSTRDSDIPSSSEEKSEPAF